MFLFLFLAPDGRIIVYGGYATITDKLAILDTKSSPFQWTIPKNIVYPIIENHYNHTLNLCMIIVPFIITLTHPYTVIFIYFSERLLIILID